MCIFAFVLYYGWPIIEAILITLPLPDPKTIGKKLGKGLTYVKSLFAGVIP